MKPFAYIKYRWVTVLFLGGFLASIFAAAAWKIIPSKFTASSMVRVLGDIPYVTGAGKSHRSGTISPPISGRRRRSSRAPTCCRRPCAIRTSPRRPMLHEQADPIRFLEEELKIESPESSEVIKISLSGEDPRASR